MLWSQKLVHLESRIFFYGLQQSCSMLRLAEIQDGVQRKLFRGSKPGKSWLEHSTIPQFLHAVDAIQGCLKLCLPNSC